MKENIYCLLTHKCDIEAHEKWGKALAEALRADQIELLVDCFKPGDDVRTRMKTFNYEALILLLTPESWASTYCQLELEEARRRGIPVFVIHLSGLVPEELKDRILLHIEEPNSTSFYEQISKLATDAISPRVIFRRELLLLNSQNPPDITQLAAENIYRTKDRTLIAEYVEELARRFCEIKDPTTQVKITEALVKSRTAEAADLLRSLPTGQHPYVKDAIRRALESVARGE